MQESRHFCRKRSPILRKNIAGNVLFCLEDPSDGQFRIIILPAILDYFYHGRQTQADRHPFSRQKDSYDSIPVAERKSLSPREYDKHSRPILIPATANRNRSLFDVLSF